MAPSLTLVSQDLDAVSADVAAHQLQQTTDKLQLATANTDTGAGGGTADGGIYNIAILLSAGLIIFIVTVIHISFVSRIALIALVTVIVLAYVMQCRGTLVSGVRSYLSTIINVGDDDTTPEQPEIPSAPSAPPPPPSEQLLNGTS